MRRAFAIAIAIALGGCGGSSTPASSCRGNSADALWVASDYVSAEVGGLSLLEGVVSQASGFDLGGDPALAVSRGRAFCVVRDQNALVELEPRCGTPISRVLVPSPAGATGPLDPQDVGVAQDGSLWVPLFEVPALVVMSADGTLSRSLDLSPYDSDGNPNASSIAIVDTHLGEKAFVVLERLDAQLIPYQAAWMLRIDVATGIAEGHTELAGRNPFGPIVAEGGALWLSDPGSWSDANEANAGVERFDPETDATSLVVAESALGGSVVQVAVSASCGVAIVADSTSENATSLVTFDANDGTVLSAAANSPLATPGYDLEGLDVVGGMVVVGDRRRADLGYPVHVFDMTDSCVLSPQRDLILALPPVSVRQAP